MTKHSNPEPRPGVSRRRFLQGAAGGAAYLAGGSLLGRPAEALAQQTSPANAVSLENAVTAGRTRAFQLAPHDAAIRGFATKTSVNKGDPVDLKLISYRGSNPTSAELQVYRLGYYGGEGGRLVYSQSIPTLPSYATQGGFPRADGTTNPDFGLRSFASWTQGAVIPGSVTSITGVYLVKVVATSGAPGETHIPFIVRDDGRPRDLLVAMPTNTWQAYNNWPNYKSLYPFNSNGSETRAGVDRNGQSRAVKVSFDRPYVNILREYNWVLRTEFPLIWWLEQQGYDLSYTDDLGMHSQPLQLRRPMTTTLAIAGHAEYWTREIRDNVEAARAAGTNIASFSANAGYWQVRLEDAGRTVVCFKTVQSRNVDSADLGRDGVNDFGPDQSVRGTAVDPLGPDATGDTPDDRPEFSTTTFRDAGAPATDPGAPDGVAPRAFEGVGRAGPDLPENALFGVMYFGDDDLRSYPLQVPPNSQGAAGEFGDHPAWRNTTVANGAGAPIGEDLIGWEWDAIPKGGAYQSYVSRQPPDVKRLAQSVPDPAGAPHDLEYLRDDGHDYDRNPDPVQGREIHAVTYIDRNSGAHVFSAGTLQWSWGLGPHYEATDAGNTYEAQDPVLSPNGSPRVERSVDLCNGVIAQATYNILADGGIKPATPQGIVLDPVTPGEPPPNPPVGPPVEPPVGPPDTGPPRETPRDTTGPALRVVGGARPMRGKGIVTVRVICPSAEPTGVSGQIKLVALVPRTSTSGRELSPRRVAIGSRALTLKPGQSRRFDVRLTAAGHRLVRRLRRVTVVAEVTARDDVGNNRLIRRSFRLSAPRKPRARRFG